MPAPPAILVLSIVLPFKQIAFSPITVATGLGATVIVALAVLLQPVLVLIPVT